MKYFETDMPWAAQGDLKILHSSMDEIEGEMIAPESEDQFIAHSESGHHHVIESKSIDLYQSVNDPLAMFVVAKEDVPMRHLKSGANKHESIMLKAGGVYKILKGREGVAFRDKIRRMLD